MPQDVKLTKTETGYYDLSISDGDLETVNGLETAIIVSLFTYARANVGEIPEAFRRSGWSGNILTKRENFELGSTLWTLVARQEQITYNRGEAIVKKALRWLISDGIADVITVEMEKIHDRGGQITIVLFKDFTQVGRYTTLWNATQPIG
jgi:phage gp46-like protein